jgi:hypothetical protein
MVIAKCIVPKYKERTHKHATLVTYDAVIHTLNQLSGFCSIPITLSCPLFSMDGNYCTIFHM